MPTGEDGGLATVHGLATFALDAGDEAGRRLAAVRLVRLRATSLGQVAEVFGWTRARSGGGTRRWPRAGWPGWSSRGGGPKGASKLTPELVKRIAGLNAAGATLRQIAAATGVSTFSVRNALGRVASSGQPAAAGVTGIRPPGTVSRARARRFGCYRIRCPPTR